MKEYKGWRYSARTVRSGAVVDEFYLSFYKQVPGRDWYDEVRYDSHESKRGRKIELPHFHIKVRGNLKSPEQAIADVKHIINELLPGILEVTES